MVGNVYINSNYQRKNGYKRRYQMGYQRMGQEYPPLRPGGQYGTVQDGHQGGPPMATGSGRNSPPSNYVPTGTHDNAWRATNATAPVGVWKGKTQRVAKKETMNQYAAFHGRK